MTAARKPSKLWRLVLTTPGVVLERPYRSKKAVYGAAVEERVDSEAGITRVTRIRVERWDTDAGRWVQYETVWCKGGNR